jgi:hypothetical protein
MRPEDKAVATPLYELLENVPLKTRLVVDDEDGMSTSFIPVGRLCHEAAAALRQLLEQQVQDGWILVPVTPTNDMTSAMADALEDPENERSSWDLAENMWHAMLPKVPTPPAQPAVPLTDEQIDAVRKQHPPSAGIDFDARCREFARAIEAAHDITAAPEKGTP